MVTTASSAGAWGSLSSLSQGQILLALAPGVGTGSLLQQQLHNGPDILESSEFSGLIFKKNYTETMDGTLSWWVWGCRDE